MKKIRFLLALWVGKAARLGMRILGRNATFLPGRLALKIDPNFLGGLKMAPKVIVVTGTNGKTTVSNLVASILKRNGYSVTNNSLGSNVQGGIAATLLEDADLLGRSKKEVAVLEVDERSSLLVHPYIQPDFLLCNNIMRDSHRRNAHTGFISFIINKALPEKTQVVLNGDDLICASLAPQCKNRTYFGNDAEAPQEFQEPFVKDIVYCPHCGAKLESHYLRYNHIGRMYCPQCGFGDLDRAFRVLSLDRENQTVTISCDGKEEIFPLLNDNIINIYNTCAAVALLTRFGLTADQIRKGLAGNAIVRSRFDRVVSGEHTITMQMAKGMNPIACTRAFHYAASSQGQNKAVIILIDDKRENSGDTEPVCWHYDCDYSILADSSISQVIFAGPRCKDHLLRALIAGVPQENIRLTPSYTGGPEVTDLEQSKDIFVLYDSYSISEAEQIRQKLVSLTKEGK